MTLACRTHRQKRASHLYPDQGSVLTSDVARSLPLHHPLASSLIRNHWRLGYFAGSSRFRCCAQTAFDSLCIWASWQTCLFRTKIVTPYRFLLPYHSLILLPRPECFVKMLSYSNLSSLLEIKRQLEKTSPTRETINSILVLVLKWRHHANGLLVTSILLNTISKHNLSLGLHYSFLKGGLPNSNEPIYEPLPVPLSLRNIRV